MSQISKARDRMLKKSNVQESDDLDTERREKRKFTVSSLTHQLERQTPIARQMTPPPQTPDHKAQSSAPLLKTIHVKIQEVSELQTPREYEGRSHESRFVPSPPKIFYRRLLHKQPLDLVVVPQAERRHNSPFKPRECLKEWAQSIIDSTRGTPFRDDYFPPERSIVFNRKILYQEQGLHFQRLSAIHSRSLRLLTNSEPTLLSLGKYTNPYLYSALTILAEEPSRILSLLSGQNINEEGIYHINLCKDGVWRFIFIDDYMPIKTAGGRKQMLGLHGKEDGQGLIEIWPQLVEKAIAKIYGTYLDLAMVREQGMTDIFKLLTGAPTSIYNLNKDFRSFLILVDTALKRGHIITLQAIKQEHIQTAQMLNLEQYQAYRILSIKKTGLKLRNMADPDLTTKLSFAQCSIFTRLVIYKLEDNYRYITYKLRHKKGFYSQLRLVSSGTSRGYFQIWQNNPAYYKKHLGSNVGYKLARTKMWMVQISGESQEGEWVENGKDIVLQAGNYDLKIHLCQQKQYDFTVAYYGEKQISMERVKIDEKWSEKCQCLKQLLQK